MPNTRPVIDENALGALISYIRIDDDEYQTDDTSLFRRKVQQFRQACLEALEAGPPAPNTHAIFLGHCFYLEVAEAEERPKLAPFVRSLRTRLNENEIETAGFVTFGGRWVTQDETVDAELIAGEGYRVACISMPSEPFRKALHAEAKCHDVDGEPGWGAGLYFDVEALQALGLNLKNEPTALHVADGVFFRVGK